MSSSIMAEVALDMPAAAHETISEQPCSTVLDIDPAQVCRIDLEDEEMTVLVGPTTEAAMTKFIEQSKDPNGDAVKIQVEEANGEYYKRAGIDKSVKRGLKASLHSKL